MVNDTITSTGLFDKFGTSAQEVCWTLAKSKIAESALLAGDEPVNRAILFFGGSSPAENYSRYYDNLKEMIRGLQAKGIKSENIIVMYADGLDPTPDQNVNPRSTVTVNSEMDFLREEGIAVVPATQNGLENIFEALRPVLKDNDHTLFYAFDHGAQDVLGGTETLIGWNNEYIKDTDFAKIVDGLNGYKAYFFAECHSGGMIEDISIADGKTFVASATTADEASFGGEEGYAGGFAKAISKFESTHDLHKAAFAMDKYADPTGFIPQILTPGQEVCVEHPQMRGAEFSVFYQPASASLLNSQNTDEIETDDLKAIVGYGCANGFVYDNDTADDNVLSETDYPDEEDITETDNIEAIAEYGDIIGVDTDDLLDNFDDAIDMDDNF